MESKSCVILKIGEIDLTISVHFIYFSTTNFFMITLKLVSLNSAELSSYNPSLLFFGINLDLEHNLFRISAELLKFLFRKESFSEGRIS